MRIGIVTTHYALNYGAVLQALALQRTVSDMGHACEIIDFRPSIGKYGRGYLHNRWTPKEMLRNIYAALSFRTLGSFLERRRKFDRTLRTELRLSPNRFATFRDVEQGLEPYDAFICGSDQIWNLRLMYDPTFFLGFHAKYPKARYLAYAPSISMADISEEEKAIYARHLEHFDALSVREAAGQEQLQPLTQKRIEVVLDPVFLYGADKWMAFSRLPANVPPRHPYILCYFIGSSSLSKLAVERVRKATGYQVVYCNVNMRDRLAADLNIRNASPQEFVALIQNASFVCTNSFHATAFSIIFQRPFLVTLNENARDSRMVDIVNHLGLKHRVLRKGTIDSLDALAIDQCGRGYEKAAPILNRMVQDSRGYLERALGT